MKFDEQACPQCAETIKKAAVVCRFCGHRFPPNDVAAGQAPRGTWGCAILFAIALLFFVGMCSNSNDTSSNSSKENAATRAAEEAEDRRKGFHCLSSWDGSHAELVHAFRTTLRNPRSFEHIETRITPVNAEGNHTLMMQYRAENGFGGMNVGTLVATIRNSNCSFSIVATQ